MLPVLLPRGIKYTPPPSTHPPVTTCHVFNSVCRCVLKYFIQSFPRGQSSSSKPVSPALKSLCVAGRGGGAAHHVSYPLKWGDLRAERHQKWSSRVILYRNCQIWALLNYTKQKHQAQAKTKKQAGVSSEVTNSKLHGSDFVFTVDTLKCTKKHCIY